MKVVFEGLKAIKQVELYTKWRKMVPEEFRDTICPKTSDLVIKEVKEEKRKKSQAAEGSSKKARTK